MTTGWKKYDASNPHTLRETSSDVPCRDLGRLELCRSQKPRSYNHYYVQATYTCCSKWSQQEQQWPEYFTYKKVGFRETSPLPC